MTAMTSLSKNNSKPRNGTHHYGLNDAPVRHASEPASTRSLLGPSPDGSTTSNLAVPPRVRYSPLQDSLRSVGTEVSRVSFEPGDSLSSSTSPSGAVTPSVGDDKRSSQLLFPGETEPDGIDGVPPQPQVYCLAER